MESIRQPTEAELSVDSLAFPTRDWNDVQDPLERRKIQNKLAQRRFREKVKENFNNRNEDEGKTLMSAHETRNFHIPRTPKRSNLIERYGYCTPIEPSESTGYPYVYQTLPSRRSVRLINLQPGSAAQPLVVDLQIIDLDTATTPFEALSYVWGDTTSKALIQCGGRDLLLTRSLQSALQRIRYADSPRLIWADAVSINQTDMEERGHQVSLMRTIYQRAARVLVAIGPDQYNDAPSAFSFICSCVNANNLSTTHATFTSEHPTLDSVTAEALAGTEQGRDSKTTSLSAFFARPWFWRLWVFQEIILARDAIVLWGFHSISWSFIGLASTWIRTQEHYLIRELGLPGVYNAHLMYFLSQHHREEAANGNISFLRLLGLTRQFEATDPRDRIYGLLGLATADTDPEAGELFMTPDYSIDVNEVYLGFAKLALQRDQSLRVLHSVQHGPHLTPSFSSPSWVPQWNKVYTHALSPSEPGPNHTSAAGMPLSLSFPTTYSLAVKGICIATVTGPTLAFPSDAFVSSETAGTLTTQRLLYSLRDFLGKGPQEPRSLAWTLTAGKDWYGMLVDDASTPKHLANFKSCVANHSANSFSTSLPKSWYTEAESMSLPTGDADAFLEAASNACTGRRLFRTQENELGLGPSALEEGDKVAVLFGGIVPFVLRQAGDAGRWRLVGECYMCGFMRGEAVERWRKRSPEMEPESFELI